MDYRLIFRSYGTIIISWGGTAQEEKSLLLNLGPSAKAVRYWKIRITRYYLRRDGECWLCQRDFASFRVQENLRNEIVTYPYRKPTQVNW
jgi:hypothetical protein